jgi:hypothetical protein
MEDTSVGYIFDTGSRGADSTPFQKLVTIDAPRRGNVVHSCLGRQGMYFLTEELRFGEYSYYVHVLPQPGGTTDVKYEQSSKMTYQWKSKEYVMPGRTTWGAAKVVHKNGCVTLRLYVDGRIVYSKRVVGCSPFRLPSQIAGVTAEIELIGDAVVTEVHIASSIRELLSNE